MLFREREAKTPNFFTDFMEDVLVLLFVLYLFISPSGQFHLMNTSIIFSKAGIIRVLIVYGLLFLS